jgi:hypothetical protein
MVNSDHTKGKEQSIVDSYATHQAGYRPGAEPMPAHRALASEFV